MKHLKLIHHLLAGLSLAIMMTACDSENGPDSAPGNPPTGIASGTNLAEESPPSLFQVLTTDERFSRFSQALVDTGLIDMLHDSDMMIFAPTNTAFEWYQQISVPSADIFTDHDQLREVLRQHMFTGKMNEKELISQSELSSLNGFQLKLSSNELGEIYVNEVLLTPSHHQISNGVIYEIDKLLLISTQLQTPDEDLAVGLYETILAYDELSIFAELARTGKIEDALNNFGPFTIFVPSNEAFKKIDAQRLEYFLSDEDAAATIIELHTIANEFMFEAMRDIPELTTLNGVTVNTSINEEGDLQVSQAKVIRKNLRAKNGVIHIVDQLFLWARSASNL